MIKFENLLQMLDKLKTEQECINYFVKMRWEGEVKCPHCTHDKVYSFADKKRFKCKKCSQIFSYKTGTIFENTKVSMRKWFLAIYIHASHKKGISSHQLAKDVGTTQKTAWFMLQRIRCLMSNQDKEPMGGTTEIDEAYFGGKEENKHKHKKHTAVKTVVIGMINRETGEARAMKVPNAEKDFLLPKIRLNVKTNSIICTDTLHAYNDLKKHYKHHKIKHSAGEYVRKIEAFKVHTNAIEGYWSYVKRGIYGIYHWCSKKHVQGYLNEFSFRYSQRGFTDITKFNILLAKTETRLTYKQLIN
jgi:transposase-like protein